MFLITGATGQIGTAVIEHLLKNTSANNVAALVRDERKAASLKEKGINIRIGNYDDTALLNRAMQSVEKVLLIPGTDEDKRVQQHQNVVNAAKKAGVQCIAYASRTLKDRNTIANKLMEGHFQTEDSIKASGLNYAIFRNVLYMDVIPIFVGEKVFDTGIHLPVGQGSVPFALRSEIGEAMAHALLKNKCDNRIYKLTGSEPYTFADVAATLTDLSGKEVAYTSIEESAFERQMKERGVPDQIIQQTTGFLTDIKNGQEAEVSPEMEYLLGRKPALLKEGLKALFNL